MEDKEYEYGKFVRDEKTGQARAVVREETEAEAQARADAHAAEHRRRVGRAKKPKSDEGSGE